MQDRISDMLVKASLKSRRKQMLVIRERRLSNPSRRLSIETIEKAIRSKDESCRIAAMRASCYNYIPYKIVELGLEDESGWVQSAAIEACKHINIPPDVIVQWMNSCDLTKLQAAEAACDNQKLPGYTIKAWLEDDNQNVRRFAAMTCRNHEFPLETVKEWASDEENIWKRLAALYAWRANVMPLDIVTNALDDKIKVVRQLANHILDELSPTTYIYRTFEPPQRVYKKCLNDVIVIAEIPKDAQIRGKIDGKCRTNQAKIVDIIGDFFGEKVGISSFDGETTYSIGDEVYISDFDMNDDICGRGFHFFCTEEQARAYNN